MVFSKTLRGYLLSYLVIFCIPTVALTYFCYAQFIRQFQQMTYAMEQGEQQKRGERIDTSFEQIKTAGMQFGLQYQITAARLEEDVTERQRLLGQLGNLQLLLSPYVEEALLWLPGHELLYANTSSYTPDSYRIIHRVDLGGALAAHAGELVPSGEALLNLPGPQGEALYFVCSYPYQSFSPQGQLVLKIDPGEFTSMDRREFALLRQGELLLNRTGLSREQLLSRESGEGGLLASDHTANGFLLLSVLDDQELFGALHRTRRIFVLLVGVVSVLSAACLCVFSYRHYKPINELDRVLARLGAVSRERGRKSSEVARAIASMEHLSSENRQLDRRLLEERHISRGLWLSRLINGQGDPASVLEELEQYGVSLRAARYAVAILRPDRAVQANRYFDDFAFHPERDAVHYYIDARGQVVLLLSGDEGLEDRLAALLAGIREKLGDIGVGVEIFAGGVYDSLDRLYNSYVDALLIITEESRGDGGLHLSGEGNPARHFLYPSLELKSLAAALQNREIPAVRSALRILSSQMEQAIYKDFLCKTICYEVANIVLRTLGPQGDSGELSGIAGRFILGLNGSHTSGELQAQLQALEESLCEALSPRAEGEPMPETFVEGILAYIHDSYTDPGFYLGQVAERFHISQNNLSQQLKRTLGISPGRYVTALRIEEAKRLLVSTDQPVKQIAGQVGFGDDSSFIRKFKSITSVTPNQYRAVHRDSGKGTG